MIKNFNQFNESFKDRINTFKNDIVGEMKRDLDPILKFSHQINDILSEYDDLGYSDYNINGFSICFQSSQISEGLTKPPIKTPCLNFKIDLGKDEILIGDSFVDEHGVDKLETFFLKLELLTARIYMEFNRGVYSSESKWDEGTLKKLKSEIEGRWPNSNFLYLGPSIRNQFNADLSIKIKDL